MSSEYAQLISQLRDNQRSNDINAAEITASLQNTAETYSEYASNITNELQATRASNYAALNQISSYIQNSNDSLMNSIEPPSCSKNRELVSTIIPIFFLLLIFSV